MSLQRIAIISAVGSNGMMRNRTVYYERHQNVTNFDHGINLQQHFNVFIGGAFLSFAITLLCVVCYCFNKIINKNSMALYRRHLMEAANQNVDIYTVEQFYETEAYAPLCETQSAQMPPSYEDVMAAEKAILTKYGKLCTSTKCCEHSQLNRLNATSMTKATTTAATAAAAAATAATTAEQFLANGENSNAEQINITDHSTETTTNQPTMETAPNEVAMEVTENGNTIPDANNQPTDSNVYDDNGNEIGCSQETPSSMCCIPTHQNDANTCCCVQKDCSCVDNCSEHCMNVGNTIANMETTVASTVNENVNPSSTQEDDGEAVVNVDDNDNKCATLADQLAMDTNNNSRNNTTHTERTQVPFNKCQCTRHQNHERNVSPVQFEVLSDNGIVRMDMSKIIDRTGLPTYDAAIKLESFGYV